MEGSASGSSASPPPVSSGRSAALPSLGISVGSIAAPPGIIFYRAQTKGRLRAG